VKGAKVLDRSELSAMLLKAEGYYGGEFLKTN
jgi:hypothetical protein